MNWISTLFVIIFILAVFFLIVMVIDGNRFHVVRYQVTSKKIKEKHNFVVLSDLHNKSYGKNNEKLIRKIKELQPEGILIAGDILTAKPNEDYTTALHLIAELSAQFPVYYGMGNHETRLFLYPETYGDMGKRYEEELEKIGAGFLRNKGTDTADNVRVIGLDLERKYYKRFKKTPMEPEYLQETLGVSQEDKFQILLAHNPDYFEEYAAWGADLVLSGHVHGGVMKMPFLGGVISPAFHLFPKYDGGLFKSGKSVMVLSRGLGMHTIPIRIFNPGELILVTLTPTE